MSFRRKVTTWMMVLGGVWGFMTPTSGAALTPPIESQAKVFLTMDEALALAFPGCKVERTTAYLTVAQCASIGKAAGKPFKKRVVYPYVATKAGKVVGTAYFDTHKVRSLRETLMIVVGPKSKVMRVELLAFAEPRRYKPKPAWYAQLLKRELNGNLRVGKDIRPMTGATLSATASVDCARRVLALHVELERLRKKGPAPKTEEKSKEKPGKQPGAKPQPKPKPKQESKDPAHKQKPKPPAAQPK